MAHRKETIIVIDDDPEIRALFKDHILDPDKYLVLETGDGAQALELMRGNPPDLVILDMDMPGLSGQDMLVALKSQGYAGPVIVTIRGRDLESVVNAFRLGATDYLVKPFREPEALAAVEHALDEVRLRRERDMLLARLKQSNRELEKRIKELTTLYSIGKSVTLMRDLKQLFGRVLEGALFVTGADYAFMLLRDEDGQLTLRAGRELPPVLKEKIGRPVQDDLASLVMTSQEPVVMSGNGLRRLKVAADAGAVVYAPLVVQDKALGVLAVANSDDEPFDESHSYLLAALADYAAIAIVNAKLIGTLESRARDMESAYKNLRGRNAARGRILAGMGKEILLPLKTLRGELEAMLVGKAGVKDARQKLTDAIKRLDEVIEAVGEMIRRAKELES